MQEYTLTGVVIVKIVIWLYDDNADDGDAVDDDVPSSSNILCVL